jgi:hypothetical protein
VPFGSLHLTDGVFRESTKAGDSVYVMQRCTNPHFRSCEIGPIHTARSAMTCVSPASNTGRSDITLWLSPHVLGVESLERVCLRNSATQSTFPGS